MENNMSNYDHPYDARLLSGIKLENFKAFGKLQDIPIKPLTLIYGPNSSGKSSIIQSLQLLKRAMSPSAPGPGAVKYTTGITRGAANIGGGRNLVYKHDEHRRVMIGLRRQIEGVLRDELPPHFSLPIGHPAG